MKIGDIYTSPFGNMVVEDVGTGWVQLVQESGNTGWTWSGEPKNMGENGIGTRLPMASLATAAIDLLAAMGTEDTGLIRIAADDLRTALEQNGYGGF